MNPTTGLNLKSLRWEIETLLIPSMCDKSSKPLLKVIQYTFSGKSQKPLLSQNNLATLFNSNTLVHCSYIANSTCIDTAYLSSLADATFTFSYPFYTFE